MVGLEDLMRRHGDSLRTLADHLGVSENTIWRWKDGRSFPSLDTLKKICERYNCDFNELLAGEAPPRDPPLLIDITVTVDDGKEVSKVNKITAEGKNVQVSATIRQNATLEELKAQLDSIVTAILTAATRPIVPEGGR